MSENLSSLAEALDGGNDEEIKETYNKAYDSLHKVLLSKYHNDEREQDKTGFELLTSKNYEGFKLSEIYKSSYEFLNELSEKLGFNEYLKVTDEYRKEAGTGIINAVDKMRNYLEKAKKNADENQSPELKAAFDELYDKISPDKVNNYSLKEIQESVNKLDEVLNEKDVRSISKAVNIFNSDIDHATQGFTFMSNIKLANIMEEPVQKVDPVKEADKEKVNSSAKENETDKNREIDNKIKDSDKVTANDILEVKIAADDKPSAGIDNEKIHKITADDIMNVKIGIDDTKVEKSGKNKIAIEENSAVQNGRNNNDKNKTIIVI